MRDGTSGYPLKRPLDLVVSLVGIALLGPVLLLLAAAIKLDSRGPMFYRGVRVGRGGATFRIYKFRTMVESAERLGGSSTPDDDPRITRVGRFLRDFKLDELPQLLNVLSGEMSIVGPRPQVEWAVARYSADERRLLSVRPGITDYASLRFRNEGDILRGSPDPDRTYMEKIHPEKMRLSLKYIEESSITVDLGVIMRTLAAIAHQERT